MARGAQTFEGFCKVAGGAVPAALPLSGPADLKEESCRGVFMSVKCLQLRDCGSLARSIELTGGGGWGCVDRGSGRAGGGYARRFFDLGGL